MGRGQSVTEGEREALKEEIKKYMKDNLRVNPELDLVPPDSISIETGATGKVKLIEIVKGEK